MRFHFQVDGPSLYAPANAEFWFANAMRRIFEWLAEEANKTANQTQTKRTRFEILVFLTRTPALVCAVGK